MKPRLAPLNALLCSLPCGVLGVAGCALGLSLGRAFWSILPRAGTVHESAQEAPFYYSLFFVWQTGAGFFLGLASTRVLNR